MSSLKFPKAYLAVSLHLHHWLLKTWSIGTLFFLNNLPIFFDWLIPFLFKFLCVLQSSILNPGGSPPPGAKECLIRIILSPSSAKFQTCSDAFIWNEIREKSIRFKIREIILFFMADEMKVLQIYVAVV